VLEARPVDISVALAFCEFPVCRRLYISGEASNPC